MIILVNTVQEQVIIVPYAFLQLIEKIYLLVFVKKPIMMTVILKHVNVNYKNFIIKNLINLIKILKECDYPCKFCEGTSTSCTLCYSTENR